MQTSENMKTKLLLFLCACALLAVAATTNVIVGKYEVPKAKVTARVVNESGMPIIGANIHFAFATATSSTQVAPVQGLTDDSGEFVAEGHCGGMLGSRVTKDGYYESAVNIPKFVDLQDGKWQPWNPTAMTVLRPIGKLVALYAKRVQTQIPALDKPCGYDLEAGDWVMPYGKGMKKDFIFTIHKDVRGMQDYDAQGELTFVNPLDGLQDVPKPAVAYSEYKWERQASENGYEAKFQLRNTWFPSGSGKKPIRSFKKETEWEGYFFRVRTVEQDGKIVSAHYGKIRGGIEIEPRETPTCTIIFTYYFNPTPNDRNLEWDTKKNLFGGLTDMETPREP